MGYHLTRLCTADCKAHPVNGVIKALFHQAQHVIAGNAGHLKGFFKQITELPFGHAVSKAEFLFFFQLLAVNGELAPLLGAALFSGSIRLFVQ